MSDLVEMASAILSQSERRVEIVAQNIANAATPAYKRRIAYASLVAGSDPADGSRSVVTAAVDKSPGKLVVTGNPFDLALSGPGLFAVRDNDGVRFGRQGRFTRDGEGHLVDALGGRLQLANGTDLVVADPGFEVRSDGTVIEKGAALGKIAVYGDTVDKAGGRPDLLEKVQVAQGAYEASNVSTADEMVQMMAALRRAESAQRIMITYDELMARAITTFGEGAR